MARPLSPRHSRRLWRPLLLGGLLHGASCTPATAVAGADSAGVAAEAAVADPQTPRLLLAAQYTFIEQWQTALDSPYQGKLSLHPQGDRQGTQAGGGAALRAQFGPDLQYMQNPGFNRDRGPVRFYALRLHLEY